MTAKLRSWGLYPHHIQSGHGVSWRDDLGQIARNTAEAFTGTLPYGNGRSYGDSCLAASNHVIQMRGLDRIISFDPVRGRLVAEAGITLQEILAAVVPSGWFLPVTPGTQYATLGGAIANDVHGKNHHVRGTFGKHLRQFELLRSDQPPQICSSTQNPELYKATIGGLGLTGIISWAEIELLAINSAQINSKSVRFGGLAEFFELSDIFDHQHEYSVAWIDCLAKGAQSGRGAFFVGDHAQYGDLEPLKSAKLSVPLTPPMSLINNLSLRGFNEAYWRRQPKKMKEQRSNYEPFFYPLDSLYHWNRIYGPKGFQQYQCVIPEQSAHDAIAETLRAIAQSGRGSFLAVLKRCGNIQSPGLMSFPLAGTSLALDFPQNDVENRRLFARLDHIVREAQGRLYPAKDAHMSAEDFQAFFPSWTKIEALRDPQLISHFWKRVTQ
jgi:FAD/FMN-containing dehydrogenase